MINLFLTLPFGLLINLTIYSQFSENYQSWTSRGTYGTYTQTTSVGTYSMVQSIVAPTASANGSGSIGYVQLNSATSNGGTNQGTLTLPAINTCGRVNIVVRSSGSNGDFYIQKSTNGGSTWSTIQTFSSVATSGTIYSVDVNDASTSVIIRINGDNAGTSRRTTYIHDITITKLGSVCSNVNTLTIPTTVGGTTSTGTQTTCGKGNDFPVNSFGSSLYGDGEDAVWEITIPSGGRNLQFDLGGSGTYKILSLHTSCAPTNDNSLVFGTTSSGTSTSFSRNLTAGTYYLWTDTWPSPTCGVYSITITRLADPLPPACVSLPTSPTNGQTNVSTTPTLSWPTAANAASYDVYFGTTLPSTPTTNVSTTSYTPSVLSITTTYNWKIVPKNSAGEPIGCSTWSFITLTPITNDDPSGSTTLTINDGLGYRTFTNVGSTNTTTESTPTCASYVSEDVWFKVVVPNDITILDFDTQTGDITDGGMAIYRGTIGSLTQIECDDDDGLDGLMPWIYREDFIPGETIYIRFWEYGGGTAGTFKMFVSTPQALPVALTLFDGTPYPLFNTIKWTTASESNSDYFDLESSVDGENWKIISKIKSAGNSTTEQKYSFVDYNQQPLTYYRLRQYDIDGQFKIYGPIVVTKSIGNKKVIKYINLLGQEINPDETSGIVIEIYDDGTIRKMIR